MNRQAHVRTIVLTSVFDGPWSAFCLNSGTSVEAASATIAVERVMPFVPKAVPVPRSKPSQQVVDLKALIVAGCQMMGICVSDFMSPSRSPNLSHRRMMIWYALRKFDGRYSLKEIATASGRGAHSSVAGAISRIDMDVDAHLIAEFHECWKSAVENPYRADGDAWCVSFLGQLSESARVAR